MSLPTLFAGPILRRVEKKQASVWLAFSQAKTVTLKIWEGDSIKHNALPGAPLVTGEASTQQFGRNLHLVVVTAKFDSAAVGFDPTKIYSYDITFSGGGLNTLGLLDSTDVEGKKQLPIGYEKDFLPSFVLPGSTADKLIIAQGSCRKMHGHGEDALSYLDEEIKKNRTDLSKRVQQLFLTGDQIYADDVPAFLLQHAGNTGSTSLVALDEKVRIQKNRPEGSSGNNTNPVERITGNISTLPVLLRQHLVTEFAGFTSSDADCHLITFEEFCATYLNYWNVRAWNERFYDKMKTLAADASKLDEIASSILDSTKVEDDPTILTVIQNALTREGKDYVFTEAFEAILNDAPKKEKWVKEQKEKIKDELREVVKFFDTLPKVSRILANVPTYMIFDDHEITDDWLITKRWRNQVFTKPLGRDILRNGMIAYAIFQDWGNVPAEYEGTGSKTALLGKIVEFGTALANDQEPGTPLIESLESQLGIGSGAGLNWHYTVESGPARTIVLNTRTERAYATLNAAPALLSEDALKKQIPATPETTTPFTMVISPVPVLGLASFEELIQPGGAAAIGVFSSGGKISGVVKGGFTVDVEAWGFNPEAFERLLAHLNAYGKVVFLSGDVHYGFSAALNYWKGTTAAPSSRFVQLTSGSLKNAWLSNLFFIRSGIAQRILTGFGGAKLEKLGWKDKSLSTSGEVSARNRARLRQTTAVIPVGGWTPGATVNTPPDFKWRFQFAAHEGDMPGDPFAGTDINLADNTSLVEGYKKVVIRHQDAFKQGFSRRLVWPAHVSIFRFEGSGDNLKAKHQYFFKGGPDNKIEPHISHEIALSAAGDDAIAPQLP